jgi:hypothetical protein
VSLLASAGDTVGLIASCSGVGAVVAGTFAFYMPGANVTQWVTGGLIGGGWVGIWWAVIELVA